MPTLPELEDRSYRALRLRERAYEREVMAALRDSLDSLRARMVIIYDRYARDGVLSLADMTRYNRLATLEKDIIKELDPALRANLRTIDRLRPEQYGESFFREAWAVDQAGEIRLKWGPLNRDAVLASLDNRLYKIARSEYPTNARATILRNLNDGLAQGKSYQRMSRDLRDALNTALFRAMRILRTEGQSAINGGTDFAYTRAAEQGVNMSRRWLATLDLRTRDQHRSMDNVARRADGLYHLPNGDTAPYPTYPGLSAGNRINCRCTEYGEIDGYEPTLRRTKEEGVVPFTAYDEWKKERPTWK